MMYGVLYLLVTLVGCVLAQDTPLPVVLWHGMGDSCCNPWSMGRLKTLIQDNKPGIYVHSLMIGENILADMMNGFIMPVNRQVELACQRIAEDENLKDGYSAVGFSQGGQFLRAVAQRCPNPPMRNLITMGGQHQGVYGFPQCPGEEVVLCNWMRELLTFGAYNPVIQSFLVQAQYWHDPMDEENYREKSEFIAEINQERGVNETYKENLQQLNAFVMVQFNQDRMVEPLESQWFGFYIPGNNKVTQTLQESELYIEDKLGLAAMDKEGKLHFLETDGDHLQFTDEWFIQNIINIYL